MLYCPTNKMWEDFYTKPLQGGAFKKFRDAIIGYDMSDVIVNNK